MLRPRRRTHLVATASMFAALYAVLGTIPVSRFVLGSGFLTASNFVAPLAGMLFGPMVGGFSAGLGDILGFAYNGQLSLGLIRLDILAADFAVVGTAGLAYSGRRKAAVALPVLAVILYTLDPLSVVFFGQVPFFWLPIISVVLLAVALALEAKGTLGRINPLFIGAITLASLMCGEVMGTLVGQNLMVRVYGAYTPEVWRELMTNFVFPAYPVERIFYTVVGTIVAYPVLRSVLRMRRNIATAS